MQIHTSEAIVLRHRDYGEADRIVSLLTLEQGRLQGFARSARASRKRFGPALEPFARIRLQWSRSRRGSLVSLREAEIVALHGGLRTTLEALALAAYGCELVERLLPEEEPHPEIFTLLEAYLDHLDRCGASHEARLLFELRLLHLVGYTPHLLHCSECGAALQGERAAFRAERGGSLCAVCAGRGEALTVAVPSLGSLSRCLRAPVSSFDGVRFGAVTLADAGAILSDALGGQLSAPLRSRSLLDQTLPLPLPRRGERE